MNLFRWLKPSKEEKAEEVISDSEIPETRSIQYIGQGRIGYNPIIDSVFDGEKTPGELGAIYNSMPNYLALRLRAYDMNLKTDLIKVITGKFFKFVVGSGLKLQAEPDETVLGLRGITINRADFTKNTEALFNLYAKSKYSDYHKKDWFHKKAVEAFKTSFLGGDCLCVNRVDEYGVNIQVIDGQQVQSPLDDTGKEDGNTIKHGIELNKRGEHVAFWVRVDNEDNILDDFERIKAVNSNGNLMAWMIYGNKERIDHHRGIPVIASILEKVAKLDRFVEASVTNAEQTANVVFAFKHNTNSTGENILTESLTGKKNIVGDEESVYEQNDKLARNLRQSVSGSVLNLTPDSDLITLSNPNQTTFNTFFRAIFVVLCASMDIPEEVALQKYEQNYSSSRAAINGWEFLLEIYREEFAKKFYEPFYRVWLEHSILTGQIKEDAFFDSKVKNDFMALEAFYNARFTGKKMPHIDPLKEAKAIRELLGEDKTALISLEQATELMGAGDWLSNFKKYLEEQKIVPEPKPDPNVTNTNNKPK